MIGIVLRNVQQKKQNPTRKFRFLAAVLLSVALLGKNLNALITIPCETAHKIFETLFSFSFCVFFSV